MSSRAARRRRAAQRAPLAKAPSRTLTPKATYTPDQVAAILAATLRGGQGTALARDPSWGQLPFGPGDPLRPAFISPPRRPGGQPEPRLGEYPVSYNLQISQVQAHIPWATLQQAADMPLFRKCIERRKGIADNDYAVVVDPAAVAREAMLSGQAKTDVEAALRGKYTAEISRATDWLAEPDRKNDLDWTAWVRLLMENMLKYDATAVYPRLTRGAGLYSLEVPDGHLFKPLIDESGGRPLPPYPAVQQILYGFPRGEYYADIDPADIDPATGAPRVPGGLSADQLVYKRRVIRGFGSPYGMPPLEVALLDGLVWMRRMGWILAEYTEGSTPVTWMETTNEVDWSVTQWSDWLTALNDHLAGSTAERFRIKLGPPGAKIVQTADVAERYKPEYDMFLVKLVAGDFGLTATELGFPEVGSLGASFHEGEQDVMERVTRRPDANWVEGIATGLLRRHLGMPGVLKVKILGLESEDEAAADQVAQNRVASGRMTLNEDRARQGLPAYGFAEADMPQLQTQRGIWFIEGSSERDLAAEGAQDPGPGGSAGSPARAGQQDSGRDNGQDKNGRGKPSAQTGGGDRPDKPTAKALAAAAASLGHAAYEAAALARGSHDPVAALEPGPLAPTLEGAAGDVAAYRKWLRNGARRGEFACKALARDDAPPEMAADSRVVFKEDPGPKAPARRGLAGTGTRS